MLGVEMRQAPYRDGEGGAGRARVYHASLLALLKLGACTVGFVIVSVFAVAAVVGGRDSWKHLAALGFVLFVTALLGYLTYAKWRTRIVTDAERIACDTALKHVELRWQEVAQVERFVVNGHVAYALLGVRGERVVVSEGYDDHESLVREMREHLGPLPGDR